MNNTELKEKIEETLDKYLKQVGLREENGKTYETYICEGNLVEALTALLTSAQEEAIDGFVKFLNNRLVKGQSYNKEMQEYLGKDTNVPTKELK